MTGNPFCWVILGRKADCYIMRKDDRSYFYAFMRLYCLCVLSEVTALPRQLFRNVSRLPQGALKSHLSLKAPLPYEPKHPSEQHPYQLRSQSLSLGRFGRQKRKKLEPSQEQAKLQRHQIHVASLWKCRTVSVPWSGTRYTLQRK